MTHVKFELRSIDAWRGYEGGWVWNASYFLEEGIYMQEGRITPRRICSKLREMGYLSDASKGRIKVDFSPSFEYLIEIQDKNTGEPLFCLMEMAE